jgi:hypothetical protein
MDAASDAPQGSAPETSASITSTPTPPAAPLFSLTLKCSADHVTMTRLFEGMYHLLRSLNASEISISGSAGANPGDHS